MIFLHHWSRPTAEPQADCDGDLNHHHLGKTTTLTLLTLASVLAQCLAVDSSGSFPTYSSCRHHVCDRIRSDPVPDLVVSAM
mmetsp:Transcript_7433/g.10720  ORF Transcript_7433/g.10720 Transcript_7433/m.10720 type:complete len:82 (+) Transcript_7433:175-420(+)